MIEQERVEGISITRSHLSEGTQVEMRLTISWDSEETGLAQIEGMFVEVVGNYYIHVVGTTPNNILGRASREAMKNL